MKSNKLCVDNLKEEVKYFVDHLDIQKICFSMFDELNGYVFEDGITDSDYDFWNDALLYGKQIGNCLDKRIIGHLNKISEHTWRHGLDLSEVDCVSDFYDPNGYAIDFEFKSTGVEKYHVDGITISPQRPNWSKTSAGGSKNGTKYSDDSINEYEYCVFCGYHIPRNKDERLSINCIYVGIYRPSDLSFSKTSTGNGARISSDKFNNQFVQIY